MQFQEMLMIISTTYGRGRTWGVSDQQKKCCLNYNGTVVLIVLCLSVCSVVSLFHVIGSMLNVY